MRAHSLRTFDGFGLGLVVLCVVLLPPSAAAQESWMDSLGRMPLCRRVQILEPTNCVEVMLTSLQSNHIVKGLVFMPGATDEFYMFKRARAVLTNATPTLLDAVTALTNQTMIRAAFHPPLLLLHTSEDPLDLIIHIAQPEAAEKLRKARFVGHAVFNDRDWNHLHPIISKSLGIDLRPWPRSYNSWHFYRHSFAGWGLSGWEALEATAFAGKTTIAIDRKWDLLFRRTQVVFEYDPRYLTTPRLDALPR